MTVREMVSHAALTGEAIGTVPMTSSERLARVIDLAATAMRGEWWRDARLRSRVLSDWAPGAREQRRRRRRPLVREVGKVMAEVRAEVALSVDALRYNSAPPPTAASPRWVERRLRLPGGWAARRSRSAGGGAAPSPKSDPEGQGAERVVNHILVGFTNKRECDEALTLAAQLARRSRARLRLVAATNAPPGLWLTPEGVRERLSLRDSVASDVREALRALPGDVGVSSVVVDVGLARALRRAIGADSYDVVVVPAKLTRNRAVRRVLSSSGVPIRVALAGDAPSASPLGSGRWATG